MNRYKCANGPGRPGCGRVAASKGSVDKFVTNEFFDFMARVELRPADYGERSLADVSAELTETEASMSRLTRNQYVDHDPQLPDEVFAATVNELTERLDALRHAKRSAEDAVAQRTTALRPGSREDVETWWKDASLVEQRAALQQTIYKVVIQPAKHRGGNKFDTDRVEIKWSWDLYLRASDAQWDRATGDERERELRKIEQDELVQDEMRAAEAGRSVE
jgi:hypothetical protein